MLDSLHIKNFRMLEDFEVKKLGRLNLIVGRNNSGKSTVLEALRVYAGNGQRELLDSIASEHDEPYRIRDDEPISTDTPLPFQDFFTGRKFPTVDDIAIEIGSIARRDDLLKIEHSFLAEEYESIEEDGETRLRIRKRWIAKSQIDQESSELKQALQITKGEKRYPAFQLDSPSPRFRLPQFEFSNSLSCSLIPTQFISSDELASDWDKIVFTEYEEIVKKAMKIISIDFENLTFINNDGVRANTGLRSSRIQRSAKVKMRNMARPVSLNSLGDGMLRVLQLALKIFSAKGGFLLIDEFENGLHYSVQEKIWNLLFEMAEKLDIQVFATTHSWDCVESFTKVTLSNQNVEGILFHMGCSVRTSDKGRVIATVYDKDALAMVTQSDLDIR
jgi:AAA15 family ATPase/GTPase